MKLIEFRADNFARLRAVEIRPDGSLVPITGKNAQGKTSILRGIWALVEGKAAAPAVAIREGEDEATLFGNLGAYKITRTIKRDSEGREEWTLKIVDADGKRITKTPQALIDSFKGDIGFDPLGWCRLPAKDQAAALRSLVKGFDFEGKAIARAAAFEARTVANRAARDNQAAADKIVLPDGPEPKAVDAQALVGDLTDAHEHNRRIDDAAASRQRAREAIDALLDEAERLRAAAATKEKQAQEKQVQLDALDPLPAKLDTESMAAELKSAQTVQQVRQQFQARRAFEEEAKTHAARAQELTEEIEAIDQARTDAIAKAKLPVKGLALGEDSVLLNGLPLAQAGTAEKIEVALAIAMAKNPELKVILIDEGSELDSDALEYVEGLARSRDFQVWIARVDESRQVGFVIEDGRVAS